MQLSILWKGLMYDTDEYCAVNYHDASIMVHSEIEGWAKNKPVYVEYWLQLNRDWQVQSFEISASIADNTYKHALSLDKNGHWKCKKNLPHFNFEGCNYVDISISPFTNTLPVNGLQLAEGETTELSVIYIDVLQNEVRRERQKYTRLGSRLYRFDNLKDFEAEIIVDDNGLVVEYPGMFELIRVR